MILEGVVTTISANGDVNVAPMGPRVDMEMKGFQLRPFRTAKTYANLKVHGEQRNPACKELGVRTLKTGGNDPHASRLRTTDESHPVSKEAR